MHTIVDRCACLGDVLCSLRYSTDCEASTADLKVRLSYPGFSAAMLLALLFSVNVASILSVVDGWIHGHIAVASCAVNYKVLIVALEAAIG